MMTDYNDYFENLNTTEYCEASDSLWKTGECYYHKASNNRYQVYEVLEVRHYEKIMMGAAADVYLIKLSEFCDSNATKLRYSRIQIFNQHSLPIYNQIDWTKET